MVSLDEGVQDAPTHGSLRAAHFRSVNRGQRSRDATRPRELNCN